MLSVLLRGGPVFDCHRTDIERMDGHQTIKPSHHRDRCEMREMLNRKKK